MKPVHLAVAAFAMFATQASAFTQSTEMCYSHADLICSEAAQPGACAVAAQLACDGLDGAGANFPDPSLHVQKTLFGTYRAWISPGQTEAFVAVREDGDRPSPGPKPTPTPGPGFGGPGGFAAPGM